MLRPDGEVKMDGLMLFTLFVGIIAFTLLYVWLVIHRQRTMAAEDALDDAGLDLAIAARRAESRRVAERLMEDAGFIIGSYVVTFGAIGRVRLVGAAPRPPHDGAAPRRGQALDVSPHSARTSTVDAMHRPQPPAGAGRPPAPPRAQPPLGAARRARPRARRRRRDRHPVPALGRRLLLQRRRDRRPRRLRGRAAGCASRARSTRARSRRSTASRRSPSPSTAPRCPCATTASRAGIFEECQPVVVHGELVGGTFEGDRVEVKHSNEYEAENADRLDRTRPPRSPTRARRQPERRRSAGPG